MTREVARYANRGQHPASLGLGCVLFVFVGCSRPAAPPAVTQAVSDLAASNTAFAADVYRGLKGRAGNICVSSYDIFATLSLIQAGARGKTQSELSAALRLPQEGTHATFRLLDAILRGNRRRGMHFERASSVWYDEALALLPEFVRIAKEDYGAELQPVATDRGQASAYAEIASWLATKTHQQIPGFTSGEVVDFTNSLLVCDATYFNGKWELPFPRGETQVRPFFRSTRDTVLVPMMHRKGRFKIIHNPQTTAVEIPYQGGGCSMFILVPNTIEGLPELEAHLSRHLIDDTVEHLRQSDEHDGVINLPRFRLVEIAELRSLLEGLGCASIFRAGADLSGVNGSRDLFVARIVHQTVVEVDEAGTVAGASTRVWAKSRGGIDAAAMDHPFLFWIEENSTGSVLFIGRLYDPLAT